MDPFRWIRSRRGRYVAISALVVAIALFTALFLRQDPNHAAVYRYLHSNLHPDLEVRFGPAQEDRGVIVIDVMIRRRDGLVRTLQRLVGLKRNPFHRQTFEIYDGEASPRFEENDGLSRQISCEF